MKKVSLAINAVKEFGWYGGIKLILQRLGTFNKGESKLYSKSLQKKIYYRPASTDLNLIINFFLRDEEGEYQIDFEKGDDNVTVIIDCGANIGLFSMIYADRYPMAQIIALEPENENFKLLAKNTAQFRNIHSKKMGVWYREAFLKVISRDTGAWGFTVVQCDEGEKDIEGISLTTLLRNFKLEKIDILKMDIEGSEFEVVTKNSDEWLEKTKIIIMETHERIRPGSEKEIEDVLHRHDFVEGIRNGENRIFYHY